MPIIERTTSLGSRRHWFCIAPLPDMSMSLGLKTKHIKHYFYSLLTLDNIFNFTSTSFSVVHLFPQASKITFANVAYRSSSTNFHEVICMDVRQVPQPSNASGRPAM